MQRLYRDRAERKAADRRYRYSVFGFHRPLLVYVKSNAERGKRPVAGSSKKKSKEIKPADGILAAVQNEIGEGASARPVRQLGINYTAGRMSAMRLGLRRL